MKGIIFDIKEMAVYDGPGIRTTVFLKGCPLHCSWCHNPEGISPHPQLMVSKASCIDCGACAEVCDFDADPIRCVVCGSCIKKCPLRLRKIVGEVWDSDDLAKELLRNRTILEKNGGGITFSGGEPLAQHEFVLSIIEKLEGMHCVVETSGYATKKIFSSVVDAMDFVIMDLKVIDSAVHEEFCGVPNSQILQNLFYLNESGKPFIIRIPLIPGVNDSEANFEATASIVKDFTNLERVEILPYHKTAGAKYTMLSQDYNPRFDVDQNPHMHTHIFLKQDIPFIVV